MKYMVVFNGKNLRKFNTEREAQDFIDRNQANYPGAYVIEEVDK